MALSGFLIFDRVSSLGFCLKRAEATSARLQLQDIFAIFGFDDDVKHT